MTGREFEVFVERLFRDLDYETELTQASRDGGVDVIARRDDVVGMTTLYIQCKNHASFIGVGVVRAIASVVPAAVQIWRVLGGRYAMPGARVA